MVRGKYRLQTEAVRRPLKKQRLSKESVESGRGPTLLLQRTLLLMCQVFYLYFQFTVAVLCEQFMDQLITVIITQASPLAPI